LYFCADHFARIAKRSVSVVEAGLIPSTMLELFRVARREKPGPVHIEVPEDIAAQRCDAHEFSVAPPRRPVADDKAIALAMDVLLAAKRPIVVIGAGANRTRTSKMLSKLVNDYSLPFVSTQMGKGVVDERSDMFFGCAALSSDDYCHVAIELADVILLFGKSIPNKYKQ
jgi:acetolactate synthase-1/2/3 large subunit